MPFVIARDLEGRVTAYDQLVDRVGLQELADIAYSAATIALASVPFKASVADQISSVIGDREPQPLLAYAREAKRGLMLSAYIAVHGKMAKAIQKHDPRGADMLRIIALTTSMCADPYSQVAADVYDTAIGFVAKYRTLDLAADDEPGTALEALIRRKLERAAQEHEDKLIFQPLWDDK